MRVKNVETQNLASLGPTLLLRLTGDAKFCVSTGLSTTIRLFTPTPRREVAKRWCYCSQVLAKSWTKLLSASTAKQIIIWFDFSFFFFPHVCAEKKKKRKNEKTYFLFYCSTVIAGRIQLGNNHHVNTYDNMLFFVFSFYIYNSEKTEKRKTQEVIKGPHAKPPSR